MKPRGEEVGNNMCRPFPTLTSDPKATQEVKGRGGLLGICISLPLERGRERWRLVRDVHTLKMNNMNEIYTRNI